MAIFDVVDSASGAIVNRIELDDGAEWQPPDGCIVRPSDGAPFGLVTEAVVVPALVPSVVSDRQFFQQLAVIGVISQDDALAAVKTGTLPPPLVQLVAALPADQQFDANMLLCGATSFDRRHKMVAVLGQAFGWDSAHLDGLWSAASQL